MARTSRKDTYLSLKPHGLSSKLHPAGPRKPKKAWRLGTAALEHQSVIQLAALKAVCKPRGFHFGNRDQRHFLCSIAVSIKVH